MRQRSQKDISNATSLIADDRKDITDMEWPFSLKSELKEGRPHPMHAQDLNRKID